MYRRTKRGRRENVAKLSVIKRKRKNECRIPDVNIKKRLKASRTPDVKIDSKHICESVHVLVLSKVLHHAVRKVLTVLKLDGKFE